MTEFSAPQSETPDEFAALRSSANFAIECTLPDCGCVQQLGVRGREILAALDALSSTRRDLETAHEQIDDDTERFADLVAIVSPEEGGTLRPDELPDVLRAMRETITRLAAENVELRSRVAVESPAKESRGVREGSVDGLCVEQQIASLLQQALRLDPLGECVTWRLLDERREQFTVLRENTEGLQRTILDRNEMLRRTMVEVCEENDATKAELSRLQSSLEAGRRDAANRDFVIGGVSDLLRETFEHWDADRDSKVGKILSALCGHVKNYDKRATAFRALVAPAAMVSPPSAPARPETSVRDADDGHAESGVLPADVLDVPSTENTQ